MNAPKWLVLGAAAVCLASGCERRERAPVAQPPATRPAAASNAPTTELVVSTLLINGRPYEFPRARLRLDPNASGVSALLFTDDVPASHADPNGGNSFYLRMNLDIDDPHKLAAAVWQYKAPSSDRADSPDGIFLNGGRKHLQPFDVLVEFEGDSSQVTIYLSGQFMMFDTDDDAIPHEPVIVRAQLSAAVETD